MAVLPLVYMDNFNGLRFTLAALAEGSLTMQVSVQAIWMDDNAISPCLKNGDTCISIRAVGSNI